MRSRRGTAVLGLCVAVLVFLAEFLLGRAGVPRWAYFLIIATVVFGGLFLSTYRRVKVTRHLAAGILGGYAAIVAAGFLTYPVDLLVIVLALLWIWAMLFFDAKRRSV